MECIPASDLATDGSCYLALPNHDPPACSCYSRRAEGCFELHTGPVVALAATVSDGGIRLASAGQFGSAGYMLQPDSVVRTFDLR